MVFQDLEQIGNGNFTLIFPPQWAIAVHLVAIAAANFFDLNIPVIFQFANDAAYRAYRDAQAGSDLACRDHPFMTDDCQHHTVVGDERPW